VDEKGDFQIGMPMNMPGAVTTHHRHQMTAYSSGLIGFTGFVGGTLRRDRSFDAVYNSVNIADINGCSSSVSSAPVYQPPNGRPTEIPRPIARLSRG